MNNYEDLQKDVNEKFNDDVLIQENFKKVLQENKETNESKLYYDTAVKKKRSYKNLSVDYGETLTNEIVKADNDHKSLKEEFRKKIWGIYIGKNKIFIKNPQIKIKEAPFMKIYNMLFQNDKLWSMMKGKTELYFYLRAYIIAGKLHNDMLNLYNNYYKKGYLAASMPISKLARDLSAGRDTIKSKLKELEKDGIIKIEMIHAKDSWDNQPHNVYIFGNINNKKRTFYIESIALQK